MPPTTFTAPSRKLTVGQVRVIRDAYSTGDVSMSALAELFGVRKQTIEQIVNYETWRGERDTG